MRRRVEAKLIINQRDGGGVSPSPITTQNESGCQSLQIGDGRQERHAVGSEFTWNRYAFLYEGNSDSGGHG